MWLRLLNNSLLFGYRSCDSLTLLYFGGFGDDGTGGWQSGSTFYEVNLEDVVPADHFLRKIDAVLDLSWLRAELAPYYSHTGCPSIDPYVDCPLLLFNPLGPPFVRERSGQSGVPLVLPNGP